MVGLYTDESILAGPDSQEIDEVITQMRQVKLDIIIKCTLEDFLGFTTITHYSFYIKIFGSTR